MNATVAQLEETVVLRRVLPEPEIRRRIRRRALVSLTECAQVLGVSRQCLSFWECGKRTPSGDNLVRYVDLLARLDHLSHAGAFFPLNEPDAGPHSPRLTKTDAHDAHEPG